MTIPVQARSVGAWLCALALLGAVFMPSGIVLCVGEGGHVAIESAIEAEPCGVPLRESAGLGAKPIEDCRDTALLQAPLRATGGGEAATLPFVASSSWTPPNPFASRGTYRPRAIAIPNLDLRAQRTVVLLV